MDEYNQKILQNVLGKFLYYSRAIDPTTLMALNYLASVQTKTKIETAKKRSVSKLQRNTPRRNNRIKKKWNDYPHILRCIPHIRTGGTEQSKRIFFLGLKPKPPIQETPPENGPVHVECRIMRNIMELATEAELRGLFENFQKATSMRTDLAEMVHQQPPTPVVTDNTAANSIVNRTSKQKISKAIDMKFYWVRNRI